MAGLQNFISSMSKAKGFARTARYAVRITPPTSLGQIINQNASVSSQVVSALTMTSLNRQLGEQVDLHCDSVSMPGHDLQSQSVQHGSAPARDMVQSHDYAGNISASFYLDSHLRERTFFEMWQKMAVNTTTHKANYYDDYIGSMEIFQLSNGLDSGLPFPTIIDKIIDVDMAEYGIVASEVYPATISGIEYGYERGNQIATMAVGFNYREWRNLGNKDSRFEADSKKLRPYS